MEALLDEATTLDNAILACLVQIKENMHKVGDAVLEASRSATAAAAPEQAPAAGRASRRKTMGGAARRVVRRP
ncbi:hypothetical protein FNF27_06339 [Cafeteria roenbergensis]|uniref:Uncharacterized protein n=1 Tax=Cafeteria roenbergensis TaxID=33653 RepID=A0A5A8E1U3_CAFRO|nr:hypothetical protein FNF29_07773 [Cafeteria roenbergensis]KAA0171429.1 hypothetical protein FNF27_06339 [Cafeteria roenbergensis]|eukprot:KAA0146892.1 hypothetical protein FNF29_07773 [Cafeteria roenbergensis]